MDEAKLQEIEARANAATPGPWAGGTDPHDSTIEGPRAAVAFVNEHKNDRVRFQRGEDYSMADAAFLAHARTDVPDLVAEVRRLTAALVTARREGAEGMREACMEACREALRDPSDIAIIGRVADTIRALLLDAPGGGS